MSQLGLLAGARLLPLFLTQGLGALNDSIFRNALIVLVTYRIAMEGPLPPAQTAALATGLFILPYFLLSALAGQVADRYEKSFIIRQVKLAELVFALLAAIAFAIGNVIFLLFALFLFGAQSAFFSPVKFSILPQHLREGELLIGNGFLQFGNFLAILLGSILGAVLIAGEQGTMVVSVVMIVIALAGFTAARAVPYAAASSLNTRVNFNVATETIRLLRHVNQNDAVFWAVMGIAWFWMMGGLFVSQLAPFARFAVGGDEIVVTWFLAVFTIGIGAGALLCNRLLSSAVSPRLAFLSSAVLSVCALDLWLATRDAGEFEQLMPLADFLKQANSWRLSAALFVIAACAGTFSVPLYALVQARSDPVIRARTIAGGNIVIAMFMVAGALITTTLLNQGLAVQEIYALAALVNLAAAFVIHRQLMRA